MQIVCHRLQIHFLIDGATFISHHPHMVVSRRENHSWSMFLRQTVAAQIHVVGALFFIIGSLILLPRAWSHGFAATLACASFCITGFMVFAVSSVYHFLHDGYQISASLERKFENLDHFAIYLFIAGTYSPCLLHLVAEPWSSLLLILVWSLAIFGIIYTSVKPRLPQLLQSRMLYTGLFILMGWTLLIRASEIYKALDPVQLLLFLGAAGTYTVGAVVYATRWPNRLTRYFGFHEIWHLTVLVAAVAHFIMILSFYS